MNKANQNSSELLIEIYYNIKTAMQNLTNVIEKVEDTKLKRLMQSQLDDYTRYQQTCEDLAQVFKVDVLDNNIFKKAQMWMSVNMSIMFDRSNRKIASINIFGTTMGIIDLIGVISDHKGAREEFLALANQLLELEESNIKALKPFLLKENQKVIKHSSQNKSTTKSSQSKSKSNTTKNNSKSNSQSSHNNGKSQNVKHAISNSPTRQDDIN